MTDSITPAAVPDTIDTSAGLREGGAVAALRRARGKVLLHTQLSEVALFDPALPDLSLIERLHAARYVARQSN
ncbi:CMD domain protein, partial [Pseudomonas sp. SIMBA_064]